VITALSTICAVCLFLIVMSWFKLASFFYEMRFGVKPSFGRSRKRNNKAKKLPHGQYKGANISKIEDDMGEVSKYH
jgi:hypothetical protein